jgi:hypothetical protein
MNVVHSVYKVLGFIAMSLGLLLGVGVFIETIVGMGSVAFRWLAKTFGIHLAQFAIFAGVVAVGTFAHWFKKKNQKWYGVVEVAFGTASAGSISFRMMPGPLFAQWATLAGCAYVITRGLNNISDAKRNDVDSKK